MNLEQTSPLSAYDSETLHDLSSAAPVDLAGPPPVPANLAATGVEEMTLRHLTLKIAYTAYNFTTDWAAERLRLPLHIVEGMLKALADEAFLEILGEEALYSHRYTISQRGAELARSLLERSGYTGAAPVSLKAYSGRLHAHLATYPEVTLDAVKEAVSGLVLEDEAQRVASIAFASGRSLFVYGPAGSGKSTLARMLHATLAGDVWVPYAIDVDGSIIRVYDPLCHDAVEVDEEKDDGQRVDGRWVKIHRPLIVVGGELTLEGLDLAYVPSQGYYEAPLHMKANAGLFVVDDFGRQKIDPTQLLNRWIVPLEHGFDHLTLQTGQQIVVPFQQRLIIATNLDPTQVTDAAFLRRMGYRLHLANPDEERYRRIFASYARSLDIPCERGAVDSLLARYRAEGSTLRACEPRDIIERVRDICHFRGVPARLSEDLLAEAWHAYFGETIH